MKQLCGEELHDWYCPVNIVGVDHMENDEMGGPCGTCGVKYVYTEYWLEDRSCVDCAEGLSWMGR